MFDEGRRGVILRCPRVHTDKHGRRLYPSREDADDLLLRSLQGYAAHHFRATARVIVC